MKTVSQAEKWIRDNETLVRRVLDKFGLADAAVLLTEPSLPDTCLDCEFGTMADALENVLAEDEEHTVRPDGTRVRDVDEDPEALAREAMLADALWNRR